MDEKSRPVILISNLISIKYKNILQIISTYPSLKISQNVSICQISFILFSLPTTEFYLDIILFSEPSGLNLIPWTLNSREVSISNNQQKKSERFEA
jgi:hypothetical protein